MILVKFMVFMVSVFMFLLTLVTLSYLNFGVCGISGSGGRKGEITSMESCTDDEKKRHERKGYPGWVRRHSNGANALLRPSIWRERVKM